MDGHYTHFMFIDSDIEFSYTHIIRMLAKDKDVICGIYPKKTFNFERMVNLVRTKPELSTRELEHLSAGYFASLQTDEEGYVHYDDQIVEVTEAGTGFLMMKRQVFQKMFEEYPSLRHIDRTELSISGSVYTDNYYYLFEAGPDPNTGRYLSEDYMFLKRWMDMGGKVYADLNVTLAHHGNYPFLGRAGLVYAYSEKDGIVGARPGENGKFLSII